MSRALQVWSHVFCRQFDALPPNVQEAIQRKIDRRGQRLERFPHHRLAGRSEYRLQVGDYRVFYESDASLGRLDLLAVKHRREAYR